MARWTQRITVPARIVHCLETAAGIWTCVVYWTAFGEALEKSDDEVALMGVTHVTVTVRNPAQPEKTWDGLFLVDTGAVDCLVPARHLQAIGLQPRSKRTYELADGSEVKMDIAGAQVEFMGETVWTTVIFAADDAEPILGVTALESVGIEVDPRSQRLKRLPAPRLK